MPNALVREVETGFGAVYTPEQKQVLVKFLGEFLTAATLAPRLSPDHEHTSTWVDGTLRLPGVGEVPEGVPPFVTTRYLLGLGNKHFLDFRELTVGGISKPSQTEPVDIAYIPSSVFFGLLGLPDEVKAMGPESGVETIAVVTSFPYDQIADLPDLPEWLLKDRLKRDSFGRVEYVEGSGWRVNVVFAIHLLGGFVIGRTGLSTDGGNDIVLDLRNQLVAARQGRQLHVPSAGEVSQILFDHTSSGR